jgi:hypothetical protein
MNIKFGYMKLELSISEKCISLLNEWEISIKASEFTVVTLYLFIYGSTALCWTLAAFSVS